MGGVNPYIKKAKVRLPEQPFTVTFRYKELENGKLVDRERVFTVDPKAIPYAHTGEPGSILDIGFGAGLDIDHACGGVCACATCHVIVREGGESCSPKTDDEEDQLDQARGLELESRLSCQCVPDGTRNLVVEIPYWNRNLVKETD